MNDSISYSDLRNNLKNVCDKVCEEHVPLLVNRRNGEDIVILSRDDYESLAETAYLLRSPQNAKRLIEALYRSQGVTFPDMDSLKNAINS